MVKKVDYNAKIKGNESKYFYASDYNKLMNSIFDAKIKNKKSINKSGISKVVNNTDLDEKIKNSIRIS